MQNIVFYCVIFIYFLVLLVKLGEVFVNHLEILLSLLVVQ